MNYYLFGEFVFVNETIKIFEISKSKKDLMKIWEDYFNREDYIKSDTYIKNNNQLFGY